uniref:host specificity protein n=1 Tax=Pseudovibrio denitrificans TaxID=258256 RepID=UPI000A48F56E|nr:host specificity protein [Pseudovibrio denitrificans]
MATMVLSNVGAAVGSAIGGPIGAIAGQALGALGGAWIDQQIFGQDREVSVGKLGDLQLQTAAEGASLPFVYGRVRVTGNIIWATRLEEVVSEEKQGGKSAGSSTTVTSHSYFANFAVALCEGPITAVRRVWANSKQLDTSSINMRVHLGTEDQQPDPLIEAKQGTAPAYKGTAYVVFERLPLAEFGNRIPQLSFEILRSIEPLEQQIKAVTLIPGAGEFTYHPQEIIEDISPGNTRSVNRHGKDEETDLVRSLDELQALCPNLKSVALVVSWFGDDLRASHCTIQQSDLSDHPASARKLECRRPEPLRGAGGLSHQRQTSLWRHTLRRLCHRSHQGTETPGPQSHVLSVHYDGHPRRQRAARPVRCRQAIQLSMARTYHLRYRIRPVWNATGHECRHIPDRCLRRHRQRLALSPFHLALCQSGEVRRRCGGLPDRLRTARPHPMLGRRRFFPLRGPPASTGS